MMMPSSVTVTSPTPPSFLDHSYHSATVQSVEQSTCRSWMEASTRVAIDCRRPLITQTADGARTAPVGPCGTAWDRVGPHGTTWDHMGPVGGRGAFPYIFLGCFLWMDTYYIFVLECIQYVFSNIRSDTFGYSRIHQRYRLSTSRPRNHGAGAVRGAAQINVLLCK